jgi:hypothetical protein
MVRSSLGISLGVSTCRNDGIPVGVFVGSELGIVEGIFTGTNVGEEVGMEDAFVDPFTPTGTLTLIIIIQNITYFNKALSGGSLIARILIVLDDMMQNNFNAQSSISAIKLSKFRI